MSNSERPVHLPKTAHSHGWIVGVFGLAAGIALMVAMPRLRAVAGAVVLVALFHLVGAAVVLGSAWALAPGPIGRWLARHRSAAADDRGLDFGWSWTALSGPWIAAMALGSIALGLQLEWPRLWPAWFVVALLGAVFFVGGLILRTSRRPDFASLPLVDLGLGRGRGLERGREERDDVDLVLDAGCGGGRTTLSIGKVTRARVVAVDRFDASYIDGGGRALLERNLRIAGLTDRVQIQPADLTALPFPEAHFDAAVSAHVIDHLGPNKQAGLAEIHRALKPGARFLMIVWVPGLVTFAMANVACLLLTTPAGWRRMASRVGFAIRDEGTFNGMWYAVLEKVQ